MVNTDMLSRQPTELDYADPSKFKFTITKLPKVEFFTTNVLLPGVNLGDVIIPTPFKELPVQGTNLTFENLEISFIVDEKLENYIELHQWLVGIGFPSSGNDRAMAGLFGDATLTITSSKNNPTVEVRFSDIYPVALSSLEFNQQATDVEYLTASCTFSYTLYELFTL